MYTSLPNITERDINCMIDICVYLLTILICYSKKIGMEP